MGQNVHGRRILYSFQLGMYNDQRLSIYLPPTPEDSTL